MANKKSRTLIFGTGAGGVNFYRNSRGNLNVVGFLDNNRDKQGQELFGKTIYAPARVSELAFDQIIIASDYHQEIYPQLVNELAVSAAKIEVFSHHQATPGFFQRLRSRLEQFSYALVCRGPGWVSDLLYQRVFAAKSDIKRFTLGWLDEAEANKVHVFRHAEPGSVLGPQYLGREVAATPIIVPEVALYRFSQGLVRSISRTVILPEGRLVTERVATALIDTADYTSGALIYHGEASALARTGTTPQYLERGVLVSGGSETNYYHWVLEVLSQLQFVRELPSEYDAYPILISEHSQIIPSIKALIDAMGITRPLLLLKSVASYCVWDLLLISAPNNGIFNYKGPARCLPNYNFARPESIGFLRENGLSLATEVDRSALPKRVFLGRKGFLRPYNQAEILARLEPLGFECVYMEEQDIHHQVAIMANADIIIGPTGAAWTNIIFASPGARALCWMAEEVGALSCYSNLADIVGVDMNYIPYRANTSASRELYYKGYSIDAETVVQWLAVGSVDSRHGNSR